MAQMQPHPATDRVRVAVAAGESGPRAWDAVRSQRRLNLRSVSSRRRTEGIAIATTAMSPGAPCPRNGVRESDRWFLLVRVSSRFVSFEAASTSAPTIRRRRLFVDGSSRRNAEIQALRAELRILPDGEAIPQYDSTVWPLTQTTRLSKETIPSSATSSPAVSNNLKRHRCGSGIATGSLLRTLSGGIGDGLAG